LFRVTPSGSKKKRTSGPEDRKYSSLTRSWSLVVKTDTRSRGTYAARSSAARSTSASQAPRSANPGSTRKPSRSKSMTWSAARYVGTPSSSPCILDLTPPGR